MSSSRALNITIIRFKCIQQPGNKIWEIFFAHSPYKGSKGPCSNWPNFWNWIHKNLFLLEQIIRKIGIYHKSNLTLLQNDTFFTSGRSNPMYGIISFGSVTNEHILPTIWAAFFLVSAPLSLSPLCTIGTKSASEGASIELMNVVWKIHMHSNQQKTYSKKKNKKQFVLLTPKRISREYFV